MKRKLHHPIWMHLPAFAILAGFTIKLMTMLPLPDTIPVHFDISGKPDRFGSPWEIVWMVIGLGLFYIAISAIFDELWSRHENRKRFNWFSLFDEITVGFLAGIGYANLHMIETDNQIFAFPWITIAFIVIPASLAAVLLDNMRKFDPEVKANDDDSLDRIQSEVSGHIADGRKVSHWEVQHMPMMTVPLMILGAIFFIIAFIFFDTKSLSIGFIFNGLLMLSIAIVFHGMTVTVTHEKITVRLETVKLKLLVLDINDIAGAEAITFSPIADFGGWGIRFNMKMRGYFWRGNRGVVVEMKNGKKYLIGSDNADNLAGVIRGMAHIDAGN